jgi:hypothetical protein
MHLAVQQPADCKMYKKEKKDKIDSLLFFFSLSLLCRAEQSCRRWFWLSWPFFALLLLPQMIKIVLSYSRRRNKNIPLH